MSSTSVPSRVKHLSFAISQAVVLAGGLSITTAQAQAVACGASVSPGTPLSITSNIDNGVCQTGSGSVVVSLGAGNTVDAGGATYGMSIEAGEISLGNGASVTSAGTYSAAGIVSEGTDDVEITIGAGASVSGASTSEYDYGYSAGIVAEQRGDVTITLNADSSVSAQSDAYSEADSVAIEAVTDSYAGYGGDVSINATSADISATSTSSDSYADATGVYAELGDEGEAAITLNGGTLNVAANGDDNALANGISVNQYDYFGSASSGSSVAVTDTTVTVSATGSSYVYAGGVESWTYSESGFSTSITLDGGSTQVSAQSTSDVPGGSNAGAVGVRAGGYSRYGDTDVQVTLNDTEFSVEASATSTVEDEGYGGGVSSHASGVALFLPGGRYGEAAEAVVTLSGSNVSVSAEATASVGDIGSYAEAAGIETFNGKGSVGQQNLSMNLTDGASLEVSAQAQVANAIGVNAETTYGGHEASVRLDDAFISVTADADEFANATGIFAGSGDSTIEVADSEITVAADAAGTGFADAIGIFAEDGEVDIDVADSQITVTADGNEGYGIAVGIAVETEEEFDITLTDSVVSVSSTGIDAVPGPFELTAGIQVYSEGYGGSITLNGSTITAEREGDELSVGIVSTNSELGYGEFSSYSEGAVTVTLDSESTITADVAVGLLAGGSSLNSAGTLNGNVIVAGEIDNSGSINGFVIAEDVTTSGTITGVVDAEQLDIVSGGVVAGAASVGTLNVAAGGELQAIMTDDIDPELAHFAADVAVLEDGARVNINGSSELFNPELDGVTYLIVDADTSLTADVEALLLRSSGLIGVDWVDCGALSLCVNVRSLDLEELAVADDASSNGVDAARGAQSVLEDLSGTETADEFMEVIERVEQQNAWDDLDGSGQGESLLASKDSDRVVSRYVQRLLQQGRSSGEEFESARGLWVQALQSDGDGDSNNGVAGFDVDTTGIAIGFDSELKPGLIIGGVLSTTDTEVDSDDNSSSVDTDTVMASVYGQWTQGPLFANLVMTYGQSDNDSKRYVVGELASADYDSDFISLRMQAGKAFGFENGIELRPRVELAYSKVDVDSYEEEGSVAALAIGSQSYETAELGAGIELSKAFIVNKGVWTPYVDFAVYHDFADDQIRNSGRFLIGGDTFVTAGSDADRTNISATMGVGYGVGANHAFKAAYEYFGNSDYDSATWMLRYSYSF